MPGEYVKRQTPLPWSNWTLAKSEFQDQRYERRFRYRIVGYYSPDIEQIFNLQAQSYPIYESEVCTQIVYLQEGRRRPIVESSRWINFFHQTLKADCQTICLNCFHTSFARNNRRCDSCGITTDKDIFKIETTLPTSLGFQRNYTFARSDRFLAPLKEEIMMKTCHPDRKNLFRWILDLEELEDMDLPY